MTARKRDVFTFRSFIQIMWVLDRTRVVAKKKSARELRQGGSDYRCCIPALAGFVSPQSIAPDGKRLFAKDRRRAIGFSRPYANGMFALMRAVSVLWTSADFAMWRLRLALFDESR